jgi:hypothetical protein
MSTVMPKAISPGMAANTEQQFWSSDRFLPILGTSTVR